MFTEAEFAKFIHWGHQQSLKNLSSGPLWHQICSQCASEWLREGHFTFEETFTTSVQTLPNDFNYERYKVAGQVRTRLKSELVRLKDAIFAGDGTNIGFGIAPYLFVWNIRRFIKYSERPSFNVARYFEHLRERLQPMMTTLEKAYQRDLLSDGRDIGLEEEIWDNVHDILKQLGIGPNEPVGTIKVANIFAPSYFPLLDNPIAEAMGLKNQGQPMTKDIYLNHWLPDLRGCLLNFGDRARQLEQELGRPILKLADQAYFYRYSTRGSAAH